MGRPAVCPEVEHRILGDEVVLFHGSSQVTYRLNALAGLIFLFCDGEHTEASILDELSRYVDGASRETLATELSEVLERFAVDGIIDRSSP